jgi:hypothetical protein
MPNPYGGGSGSIVVTPRKVQATERRLGSAGWRLSNTKHGHAVRRVRHTVTTNKPKVERTLPILDDATQERLARALSLHSIVPTRW